MNDDLNKDLGYFLDVNDLLPVNNGNPFGVLSDSESEMGISLDEFSGNLEDLLIEQAPQVGQNEVRIVLKCAKITKKPNNIYTRSEATKKSQIMKQVFSKSSHNEAQFVQNPSLGTILAQRSKPKPSKAVHPKPVTFQISEPTITPVSASRPNPQASIPYPSRRNDERNRERAKDQIEKFYQIFKDMSFEISFANALMLMPKFASTLKALIGNKEKLSEMARTPLNETLLCDYVPEHEYPKYLEPSNVEAPIEDQPLPDDASPIALSLSYVADSDPEKDPKEDPKEDPTEYHADDENDDDDDDDEEDDEDVDEDDEEGEEDEEAEEH
nr:reverse transcriptase domain-containing protein [Tanacetum cinerariifolium]